MRQVSANTCQDAERYLRKGLERLDLEMDDHRVGQLIQYIRELQKWNKKVNLVAKNTDIVDLIDKHFLDSLTVAQVLVQNNLLMVPLLDVGSGAGFPGLPLKIALPSLKIFLLEPRQRRVSFLKHVIRLLALDKIEVLMHRTDDREAFAGLNFGVITGRAVADVGEFLKMVSHLASSETTVICMQGTGGSSQWRKSDISGDFTCVGVEETMLPLSGAERYLLLFRKVQSFSGL